MIHHIQSTKSAIEITGGTASIEKLSLTKSVAVYLCLDVISILLP
jgi:hypothetical protein